MAIVTDPDLLTRESVIFGTETQKVSVYPVGDSQRGDVSGEFANDAWVSNTSNIVRETGAWTSVVNGDVVCILQGPDAGHYYVNNNTSALTVDLTRIIDGTSGATTSTGLTVSDITVQNANVHTGNNSLEITAHGLITGDAYVLDNATPPGGTSDSTVYYFIVNDANFVRLAASYDDALANSGVAISTAGTGDTDFHERVPITIFNNGASASESIEGNPTSGDADGDILDGVTLQAIYSFGKEEWRSDSIEVGSSNTNYNDDLIRHQFPYEAITSEQFEIGGGAAHDNWNWFDNYSRKKVRTGGWAEKISSTAFDLARETGIVTLGSLDTDTQVYYQQTSATTVPVNFTFLGTINEAVRIYYDAAADDSPDNDFTTYLKLFARKKGKTYVQSEIADIGVTTIQTIVNRFPLAHADDTAITSTDGEVLGTAPYRSVLTQVAANTGGDTVTGAVTFDDPDGAFLVDEVVSGDTLEITSGSDIGNYTISTVDDANTLTIGTDFEFSGWAATSSAVDYLIKSNYRLADKTTTPGTATVFTDDGEATAASNNFIDTTNQHFITGGVTANDILWIQESGTNYGIYKITGVTDANTVVVDDTDQPMPTSSTLDYMILTAGMYLQYKNTASADNPYAGISSIDFQATNGSYGNRPTLEITGDTWHADVVAGTMLVVSGSENTGENDGRYTVFAQESSTIISLVPTDVLITNAADTTASCLLYNGFKRTIGTTVYGFNWKLTGNGGELSDAYQFVQHQLRQTSDIDYGEGTSRGDITDLLMSYAAPTGTTINMFIDDLNANDLNNITMQDHSAVNRTNPFTAAGTLTFNTNLQDDTNAKYWLFFTNDDAGDNLGRDYGTEFAIIVEDKDSVAIQGDVSAASSVAFTYDYDGNTQRGDASAGQNAPVTLVAIGLDTAQFVISTATIIRATGITISAVAALERNYLNP